MKIVYKQCPECGKKGIRVPSSWRGCRCRFCKTEFESDIYEAVVAKYSKLGGVEGE